MNILFVAVDFLPNSFSESLCSGRLVLSLLARGHHVTVISREKKGDSYSSSWNFPWFEIQNHTESVSYPLGNKVERLFDWFLSGIKTFYFLEGNRWARRAVEKGIKILAKEHFDCVISRSPGDVSHIVGYHLARYSKLPWIANWNDPAGAIWPYPYCQNQTKLRLYLENLYTRFLLKRASCNTFPAKTLMRHFTTCYPFLKGKLCEVIPHTCLPDKYLPSFPQLPPHKKMRLCHAGNLSAERNPDLLFKALAEFERKYSGCVSLDILGKKNDYCSMLIEKYKLAHTVSYLGSCPFYDSLKLMAEYDILVLVEAQLQYGIFFPSKIVDYMQVHKPILAISPSSGFVSEILTGNGVMVTDNTSLESIFQGLEKLYQSFCRNSLNQDFSGINLLKTISSETVVINLENLINRIS